jgi:hypothetical protein
MRKFNFGKVHCSKKVLGTLNKNKRRKNYVFSAILRGRFSVALLREAAKI